MSCAGRRKWPLASIPILFFVIFLGAPLLCIIAKSQGNIFLLLPDADFIVALQHSFLVSSISAALTVLIAFLLAYTVHHTRIPQKAKSLITSLACLPMLLPTVTYGFAILYSFGQQGLLTNLLGGVAIDLYGMRGLVLGYIIYTLPTAYILLNNSMNYVDQRFFIVSQLMEDHALSRFWNTLLRPLLGTLGTAFVQSFFLCFTDYGIPMSIGGQYEVVSMRLYQYMLGALPDFQKGASAAVIMLLPSLASLILLHWLRRFDFRYDRISPLQLPKRSIHDGICGALSAGILIGLCLIFAVIFIIPFVHSWPYATYFSLEHVAALFTTPRLLQIYRNSIVVAGASALFGTVLAYFSALLNVRMKMPRSIQLIIDGCATLSNIIPGMVLGVGFMFAFSGTILQYTFFIIIACNMIHFFNTPYTIAVQSLSKLSDRWEVAASLMGDSWCKTVFRILLPNTLSTVLEMLSYYFTNSMVTISAVVFLAGAHTMVITTRIKELQNFSRFDEIFALSLLILITNLLVKAFIRMFTRPASVRSENNQGLFTTAWKKGLALLVGAMLIISPITLELSTNEKIIIYSNADEDVIRIMEEVLNQHGFQDQYILQSFGTSELGGKLLVEKQNIEADIVTISDYYLTSAQAGGLSFFDPGYAPSLSLHANGFAAPLVSNTGCVIVNDIVLRSAGLPLPGSLADLADPRYEGYISLPSIQGSSTGWLLVQAVLCEYGETEGKEILSRLLHNAGPHLEMSGSGPLTKITSGEVAVAYGIQYQAERAKSQGMPITCLPLNACYTMTESLAVVDKGEKNKHLAQKMAICLQQYARPIIAEEYPSVLYPDESNDIQVKTYPNLLTAELLPEHQTFFLECLSRNAFR